jgi:hypothetical protein
MNKNKKKKKKKSWSPNHADGRSLGNRVAARDLARKHESDGREQAEKPASHRHSARRGGGRCLATDRRNGFERQNNQRHKREQTEEAKRKKKTKKDRNRKITLVGRWVVNKKAAGRLVVDYFSSLFVNTNIGWNWSLVQQFQKNNE